MKLTVVVPIYKNNDAQQLRVSLDSLLRQTLLPNEILVVADGPISTELEQVVSSFKFQVSSKNLPIEVNYLKFEQNEGLGEAMRKAVLVAKEDYIARMDADDICLPNRFEKQMNCFEKDANLSVVGGQIAEFDPVAIILLRDFIFCGELAYFLVVNAHRIRLIERRFGSQFIQRDAECLRDGIKQLQQEGPLHRSC